jgi:hypothetical protein
MVVKEDEAGLVWDSMPVPARVALCSTTDTVPGRTGTAEWKNVWHGHKQILTAILVEDGEVGGKPNTDPQDRSIHAAWTDGKPVYRASMAGRCLKELFLWRIGTGDMLPRRDESSKTTNKGILAAREGTRHETWIVEDLLEEGYEIAWAGSEQREMERRYKRYIVRSHPDGMIRGLELGDEWHVLECKALNEDRYALWQSARWEGFVGYAHQVSIEMDLSGAPAYFIVKNRNTGESERLIVASPPIDPKIIYRKFSSIEDIVDAAEEGIEPAPPECGENAEWYFCPFFSLGKCDILQGEGAEEIEEVDDPTFEGLLAAWKECKAAEKQLAEMMAGLRIQITDRMVAAKLKIASYFASYKQKERRGFNIPAAKQKLEELGEDPAQFDKVTTYMELRVTGGPKAEEESEGLTE